MFKCAVSEIRKYKYVFIQDVQLCSTKNTFGWTVWVILSDWELENLPWVTSFNIHEWPLALTEFHFTYTGWSKNGTLFLYALTLSNINQFTKLFQCQNQKKLIVIIPSGEGLCTTHRNFVRYLVWNNAFSCTFTQKYQNWQTLFEGLTFSLRGLTPQATQASAWLHPWFYGH